MSVISSEYPRMRNRLFHFKMATPMKLQKLSRGRPKLAESEKKRRKYSRVKELNMGRITIGNQIDRWNAIKKETGAQTNRDLARLLIDR